MDEKRSGVINFLSPAKLQPISADIGHLFLLVAMWVAFALIVDPAGEFMVNDDWAFTRAFESLIAQGRMGPTGWGPEWAPGGPSLIAHVIWARLFTLVSGFSLTMLRISVLFIGILGSLAFWLLLRVSGNSRAACSLASMTVILNPLFFSQCFTFMTDITFVSFAIFSMLFLFVGVEKSRKSWLIVGFAFSLCSTLTRQIGVVIPLAFLLSYFGNASTREISFRAVLIYVVLIVLIPWIGYEYVLFHTGSTPLTKHQVIHEIFRRPVSKGLLDYLVYLYSHIFHVGLLYVAFLLSPALAFLHENFSRRRAYAIFFAVVTSAFVGLEIASLTRVIDLPIQFYRNVIYNFGIGPILLKDVYLLGIDRTWTIPAALYLLLIYWAVLSAGGLAALIVDSVRSMTRSEKDGRRPASGFLPRFALAASAAYFGVILLTGFHDRYLIPMCVFLLIWLFSEKRFRRGGFLRLKTLALVAFPLILMGVFSIAGTHDFMETKRSLKQAQDYLVHERGVNPCDFDGGLEFNGYHCYRSDFKPVDGLSWWWVEKEDYLLALGPLPGYDVIRAFPFQRYMGPNGEVLVLTRSASRIP
jgi:hypothetical protein